jgi:5-methylcytosine-specific restriction endonuclease McrA
MSPYWNGLKRSPIKKKRSKPRPGRLEGKEMDDLREIVFTRDMGICQNCGRKIIFNAPHEHDDSFHLAHTKGKRMWGDSPETTRAECGRCHRTFHNYGPSREKPVPAKSPNFGVNADSCGG